VRGSCIEAIVDGMEWYCSIVLLFNNEDAAPKQPESSKETLSLALGSRNSQSSIKMTKQFPIFA